MKRFKQHLKYGAAVMTMAALPAISFANAELNADAMVASITSSKVIIVAVGMAIFSLIGLIVSIRYAKRAAN